MMMHGCRRPPLLEIALGALVCALGITEPRAGEAKAEKPRPVDFSTELYHLTIFRHGHWTVWAKKGENKHPVAMLWPWPLLGGKQDPIRELTIAAEEKEGKFHAVIEGRTDTHRFRVEIIGLENEVRAVYSLDTTKEMDSCRVGLTLNGAHIAGRRFEWGPEQDVPEAVGFISADKIRVDTPRSILPSLT